MTSIDEILNQFEKTLKDARQQHEEQKPAPQNELPPPLPVAAAQPPPLPGETGAPPPLLDFSDDAPHQDLEKNTSRDGNRVVPRRRRILKIVDAEYGELRPSNLLGKCPACKMPVEKDAKFCELCGEPLV